MKSFDILYYLQVLSLLLYGTDSTTLTSLLNTDVINRCRSIMNSKIDNPHLALHYTPNKVYEGQSVTLCCCSKSLTKSIELWLEMKSLVLSSKYDTNVLCHEIMNVSRNDSGVYSCFEENKFAIVNTEVKLKVLYPPDIPDQHVNFTENDVSRTLQCLAHGVPAKYTYGQWKHLSNFGEHIRYLNSTTDGRVILPVIAKKRNRYQDSGIYICTASNGVLTSTGNTFPKGKIFVISNGPPIFVDKIAKKPYGHPRKMFNLTLVVYTKSEIDCNTVKREDYTDVTHSMQITSVNSTTIFHGTEISVEVIEVVLSFKLSSYDNSHLYYVTLCNGHGNNSFAVEINPVKEHEMTPKHTKIAVIVIAVMLVICVVISGITIFLTRKRNTRRNASRATEGMTELAEGFPIPLNHAPQKAIRNVKRGGETSYSHVWC